jgi:hypothetical protein
MIGNCTISALIDAQARIVWCCMPRFDGDPFFYALIDSAEGIGTDGTMAVELENFSHSEQHYDHATAILRTRLFDSGGLGVEISDFAPRFLQRDRLFRPAQLVRRIRPSCARATIGARQNRRAPAAATTCALSEPAKPCG